MSQNSTHFNTFFLGGGGSTNQAFHTGKINVKSKYLSSKNLCFNIKYRKMFNLTMKHKIRFKHEGVDFVMKCLLVLFNKYDSSVILNYSSFTIFLMKKYLY